MIAVDALKELMYHCYEAGCSVDEARAQPFIDWWNEKGKALMEYHCGGDAAANEEYAEVLEHIDKGMATVMDTIGYLSSQNVALAAQNTALGQALTEAEEARAAILEEIGKRKQRGPGW